MDLHEDIHRAIESYYDPDEFRRYLNSAIQNSRGVTFLLQKRKAKWSNFGEWYGAWQEAARNNPVLSWGVTARNRVVKEEDLKTFSEARISVYGERLKEAEDVFVVPPEFTVEMVIADYIRIHGAHDPKTKGTVRVRRRWVDDQLTDYELVAALREMYDAVASIVKIAHGESGMDPCAIQPFKRHCVGASIDPNLKCLPAGDTIPSVTYDLETGETGRFVYQTIELDDSNAGVVGLEKYGPPPAFSLDPLEHALQRMELSKRFLEVDGYSGPMLALFKGDDLRIQPVDFLENEPRELKIEAAIEAQGAWQFDGAVYSSETWVWTPGGRGSLVGVERDQLLENDNDYFGADRAGDRDEALIVIALTKDGRSRTLTQPYGRTAEGIVYGSLDDDDSGEGVPPFMNAIWRQWPRSGQRSG